MKLITCSHRPFTSCFVIQICLSQFSIFEPPYPASCCTHINTLITINGLYSSVNFNWRNFLTCICLSSGVYSVWPWDLASRTVILWRQNSSRFFSQRWPWNTLRNRMCGVACCRKEWGGSEIMIINAIRWKYRIMYMSFATHIHVTR
jgi:hypothetical protein